MKEIRMKKTSSHKWNDHDHLKNIVLKKRKISKSKKGKQIRFL
jgi:hypothetical protein